MHFISLTPASRLSMSVDDPIPLKWMRACHALEIRRSFAYLAEVCSIGRLAVLVFGSVCVCGPAHHKWVFVGNIGQQQTMAMIALDENC